MSTSAFRKSPLFRYISFTVLTAFTGLLPVSPSYAQVAIVMPPPGEMIHITRHFEPPQMVGLKIDLKDPFSFDFIMDQGENPMPNDVKKEEFNKIIKYFLVSLAMPNKDLWVNLSPYESKRIIPEIFAQTEMGRDLLAQDYILKQFTASLMYPENGLGKKFWDKVYQEAQARFGTTEISVNTFNKVWIMADHADIYQKDNTAFLIDSHLKVMLEQDYKAITKNKEQFGYIQPVNTDETMDAKTQMASQLVREIIIPAIEKEVNEGKSFAAVRQVYNAEIMATWFKRTLRASLLGQVFADKAKISGQRVNDPQAMEKIYKQYLRAYKKGVFNYIREDATPDGQTIPRKYFSGGSIAPAALENESEAQRQRDPRNAIFTYTAATLPKSAAMTARVTNWANGFLSRVTNSRLWVAAASLKARFSNGTPDVPVVVPTAPAANLLPEPSAPAGAREGVNGFKDKIASRLQEEEASFTQQSADEQTRATAQATFDTAKANAQAANDILDQLAYGTPAGDTTKQRDDLIDLLGRLGVRYEASDFQGLFNNTSATTPAPARTKEEFAQRIVDQLPINSPFAGDINTMLAQWKTGDTAFQKDDLTNLLALAQIKYDPVEFTKLSIASAAPITPESPATPSNGRFEFALPILDQLNQLTPTNRMLSNENENDQKILRAQSLMSEWVAGVKGFNKGHLDELTGLLSGLVENFDRDHLDRFKELSLTIPLAVTLPSSIGAETPEAPTGARSATLGTVLAELDAIEGKITAARTNFDNARDALRNSYEAEQPQVEAMERNRDEYKSDWENLTQRRSELQEQLKGLTSTVGTPAGGAVKLLPMLDKIDQQIADNKAIADDTQAIINGAAGQEIAPGHLEQQEEALRDLTSESKGLQQQRTELVTRIMNAYDSERQSNQREISFWENRIQTRPDLLVGDGGQNYDEMRTHLSDLYDLDRRVSQLTVESQREAVLNRKANELGVLQARKNEIRDDYALQRGLNDNRDLDKQDFVAAEFQHEMSIGRKTTPEERQDKAYQKKVSEIAHQIYEARQNNSWQPEDYDAYTDRQVQASPINASIKQLESETHQLRSYENNLKAISDVQQKLMATAEKTADLNSRLKQRAEAFQTQQDELRDAFLKIRKAPGKSLDQQVSELALLINLRNHTEDSSIAGTVRGYYDEAKQREAEYNARGLYSDKNPEVEALFSGKASDSLDSKLVGLVKEQLPTSAEKGLLTRYNNIRRDLDRQLAVRHTELRQITDLVRPSLLNAPADHAILAAKPVGGINLSDENLTINVKVDGAGMPLPEQYQDRAMMNLNGLTSIIRKITPLTTENIPPELNELLK